MSKPSPYRLPAPARAPLTPEQQADADGFREQLRAAIEKAQSDGTTAYVQAPSSVSIADAPAFWAAVEVRLAGTGWAIIPTALRDAGRGRIIGPVGGG